MSAHTPGPWLYQAGDHGRQGFDIWNKTQAMRARVTGMSDIEERRANARLIAAAPDLLDALRDMVDFMTGRVEGETAVLHNALSAIAKATGEPS